MGIPRIGAVSYLNARPLVAPLEGRADLEMVSAVPAALADAMAAGRLDAALLPVVEAVRDPAWRAVEGVGIGSDGPVRSVLLYLRRPAGEVATLAPDPASRTSNVLARLLLARRGSRPRLLPPGAGGAADAAADAVVVIGDPAFSGLAGSWSEILDLGEAWRLETGLPFVFAVWVVAPSAPRFLPDLLRAAMRAGTAKPEATVRPGGTAGLDPAATAAYLTRHIRYGVGLREREGLARFLALARAEGILEQGPGLSWV